MIILMCISFYASRLLLKALGVTDFGIYSVVGSIAATFTSIKSLFSESIQRFFNVSKGKSGNHVDEQILIFNISLYIHIALSFLFIIIAEVVGLWLLSHKLDIPYDRSDVAVFVFQTTIISTVISILSIPYDAVIIANERIGFYAAISIVDAVLKLLFILLLPFIPIDSLSLYSGLMILVPLITIIAQIVYCRRFRECRYHFNFDKLLFKDILGLSGWNFFGNISFSFIHEGINMLLNVFGGVVMNAARAIAYQMKSVTSQLSINTMVAIRPYAMQRSAQLDKSQYFETIILLSRISLFTIFIPVIPLFFYTEELMMIWLGQVPEYAVLFTRLVLIGIVIRSLHEPINIMNMSFGSIKVMMITESIIMLSFLFLVYFILKCTNIIWTPFLMLSFMELIIILGLIFAAYKEVSFPIKVYFKKVLLPMFGLFVLSAVVGYLFVVFLAPKSALYTILYCVLLAIVESLICLFFLDKKEMTLVMQLLKIRKS